MQNINYTFIHGDLFNMSALALGIVAALLWGFHDICVRFISRSTPVLSALITVLTVALISHTIWIAISISTGGDGFQVLNTHASILAAGAGLAFLVASLGLYYAFERGPVKLVAPIIASFPVLSVLWADIQGRDTPILHWVAVFVIISGVSIVAATSNNNNEPQEYPPRVKTIIFSALAAFGYAVAFSMGQEAARLSSELISTLVTRIVAVTFLILFIKLKAQQFFPGWKAMPLLIMMGLADVIALNAIIFAAHTERPEFASVAASTFGMITIIMAWLFLKEGMNKLQWLGCILAFVAIGYLAL